MNHYELLCILSGKIAETDIATVEKSIEDLVKKNASIIHYAHHMDRKRLAYPIEHHHYGYYFVIEFDADSTQTATIDAELKLTADVLRHSLVANAKPGSPPVIERKQSFDVLPGLGDIEQPVVTHPAIIMPSKNDVVATQHTPPSVQLKQIPVSDQPKIDVAQTIAQIEQPLEKSEEKEAEPRKEKKRQEKLSYEELDKKLDEIINNDLF